jgi:hypothetical protein
MEYLKLRCAVLLLIILLFVISFSSSAQVYQWQDDSGVTHFGDKPVIGATQLTLIELNKQSANKEGSNQLERNRKWFGKYSKLRAQRELAAASNQRKKYRAATKKIQLHCGKLRSKLASIENKYKAQKRSGITFKLAQQKETQLQLQRERVEREC